jgi:hypothetical protein
MSYRKGLVFLLAANIVSACGGSKVINEPEPLVIAEPLASASDTRISANLDWIIYRGGPGSWVERADWDEYLIRVHNDSEDLIRITGVVVIDSTDTQVERGGNRVQLIEETKQIKSRYDDKEIEVSAGPGSLVVAGTAAAAVTGVTLGVYAAGYGYGAAATGVGLAAASVVLIPIAVVDYVARSMNNEQVDQQIKSRQTLFPSEIRPTQEVHLDLFFPLAPSPKWIELTYLDSNEVRTLIIDTSSALDGLHIAETE